MAVYILPYRYLIETEEEKMDVEYMSCYYEDMIENYEGGINRRVLEQSR